MVVQMVCALSGNGCQKGMFSMSVQRVCAL